MRGSSSPWCIGYESSSGSNCIQLCLTSVMDLGVGYPRREFNELKLLVMPVCSVRESDVLVRMVVVGSDQAARGCGALRTGPSLWLH